MDVRKIGIINREGTKYITIPMTWGEAGQYVSLKEINNKELKVELIED
jgi:hypothetical protein